MTEDWTEKTEERSEGKKGVGKILRSFAIWLLVVIIAVAGGFATGYFLRYKETQELRQLLAEQKATTTLQVTSLEKQVLEAQKTQLEKALARAKLIAGLTEVLESLTAASAEVEQGNFGRARQKIDAAKGALNGADGISLSVREVLGAKLNEITAGLQQLDPKVGKRIEILAQELESGQILGPASR